MATIREALLSVDGEDSTSILPIISALSELGFNADAKAGGAFRLLDAHTTPGLNFKQQLALKAAIKGYQVSKVTRKRAGEAVRQHAHSRQETGQLLAFLGDFSDQQLGKWMIDDEDHNETICAYIRTEAERALACLGVGSSAVAADVLVQLVDNIKQLQQGIIEQHQQLKEQHKQQQEIHKRQQELNEQNQEILRRILHGQSKRTSSGSSKDSELYRREAFEFYGYSSSGGDVPCMVTGEVMPADAIRAGHIFRQGWNTAVLPLLGIASVHDPRNIILVRAEVEAAFHSLELAIIPQSGGGEGDFFDIHVLKPSLLAGEHPFIGTGDKGSTTGEPDSKKWADVHKSHLHVKGTNLPSRRLLAMHAQLAIGHAVRQGWLKRGELTVSEAGWASPVYDSGLMRRYLGDITTADVGESQQQDEWEEEEEQQ